MHSKAMLVQDLTNLVCIWHKRDRIHLFAIVICFSLIFRFLKLKLDLEMAAPLKARQKQNAKAKLWPLFSGILKVQSLWIFYRKGKPLSLRYID